MDIIFLHGWGGNGDSLLKLASNFGEHKTHVLEMPGHGFTPEMNRAWSMEDFVYWLQSYINAKQITNYILVGHSFGGKIILDSIINEKVNPEKIILIDNSGVRPKNSAKKTFWKFISKIYHLVSFIPGINNIRKFFYIFIIREKDYLNTKNNLKETFKIINENFYDDKLNLVNVETLIIWGRQDKTTPLWMGELQNDRIKNSKLIVLEGTHGLPLKKPELVAKYINNFIKND